MSDSTAVSHETDSSKGSSRLKKLTSSSTWTSPFRTSGKSKNMIQEFKESNSVSHLHVPKKFTSHPNLDAGETVEPEVADKAEKVETTDKKEDIEEPEQTEETEHEFIAADPAVDGAPDAFPDVKSVDAVKNEPLATSELAAEEAPETKTSKAAETEAAEDAETPVVNANTGDDDIKEQVKETPIELDVPVEDKYVPVDNPNQKVLDQFADKPALLNRYRALNGAIVSQNPTTLDGPDKVIDLGSGLRLTQQQLLDIAAKRVAPVIASINEEVLKTQQEDKIVEKKEFDATVEKHNSKLEKDFGKYAAKVDKQKEKFNRDIATKLGGISKESDAAIAAAEEFDTRTRQEITTANEEYMERERQAMEQHEIDKETLLKNHDELEATKKQELEDAKTNQTKTTEEIETLQETKSGLDNSNSELSDEIERLTKELAEREEELSGITDKLTTEKEAFNKNEATKKELNEKVAVAQTGVEEKKHSKSKLAVEVGLLGSAVAAYAATLTSLKSDNSKHPQKIAAAKEKFSSWNQEKQDMAEKVAREHEQQRLEAREAAATEKIKAEIEEEKQRLEEEKQRYLDERARLEQEEQERKEAQEQKEAEEKAAKEAEEKRLAEEKEAEEQKAAEEKKLAEEKAAKEKEAEKKAAEEKEAEKKAAEEKAAKEKKAADEKAAKAANVNTFHHSTEPETTVVGLGGKDAAGHSDKEAAVPIAAHKKETSPVAGNKDKDVEKDAPDEKHHKTLTALGVGAGAGAGALAGVGVGAASSAGAGAVSSANGASSAAANPDRRHSLSKKLRSVFGRSKDDTSSEKSVERQSSKSAEKSKAPVDVKPVDTSKQPHGQTGAGTPDELFSLYEEVSDKEYEQHKGHPDYIEVDAAEAEKLLKRHRDLVPRLQK